MRYVILLTAFLLPAPAYPMSGVIGALVSSSSYPASVTNDFQDGTLQGWTSTGGEIFTGAWVLFGTGTPVTASITKTVVTGAGTFSFPYALDNTESPAPTGRVSVDGGSTWTGLIADGTLQTYSTTVTAGTRTFVIEMSIGANLNAGNVNSVSYPHPQVPLWPSATAIGGVTVISQAGPTDTGTQTGMMSSGTISVDAECSAFAIGASAGVYLEVDGVVRSQVVCGDGGTNNGTLTYTVTAGTHSVRLYGTADDSNGTFSGTVENVQVP